MTSSMKQRIVQLRQGKVPKGYKKSKLGIVPNDWNETAFSTLFTSTSQYTDDLSRYPLYSLTIEDGITAKTERYERSHLVKKENAYKVVRPGDYAYNPMNIRFGAVARHKGSVPVAVSGYYDIFTTVHEGDFAFMDSFLTSDSMIAYYNKVSTGSLIEKQRVHFSDFMEFSLALPPIEERKRIAEILTAQDKVIELKEKRLAEKQRQKKYLMQQLLTGKKRLNGFSGEWEVKCLCDACYLVTKCTTGELCDYVSTENMAAELKNNVCFEDSQQERQGIEFVKGDILIANIRPYLKKVWKATKCGVCSADVLVLRPTSVSSEFLYRLIANDDFFSYVMIAAKGSKMPRGDKKHIMSMPITLPISEKEQMAISKFMNTVDNELELFVDELTHEKQKKKALIQLLLTGIVRVKEATGSRFPTK